MKSELSQKTMWLLVASLALVMVTALTLQLSADRASTPPTFNAVNETYPAPAAQEAAPMPPAPAADPDEGIDEAQGEAAADFSA